MDEEDEKPTFLDKYDVEELGSEAQKAAYTELEVHLTDARTALQKATKLATEHKLSFRFGINTFNSNDRDYEDGGWQYSAVC